MGIENQEYHQIEPFVLLKSYKSFEKYFEDATSARIVSYCVSPDKILDVFTEFELNQLEVLVGEKTGFKKKNLSPETVDELERLKEAGDLVLYLSPDHDLHTKLYIIETSGETVRILNGSPNFTVSAWDNHIQKNVIDVFEVPHHSKCHEQAIRTYEEHRTYCEERFLDDLTAELEASDEPREEVIEWWLAAEKAETDEVRDVHFAFTEQLGQMGPEIDAESEIRESLRGYEKRTQDEIAKEFRHVDATITNSIFRTQVAAYGRAVSTNYDIPKMWVANDGVYLLTPKGEPRRLTEELPTPEKIDAALANVEAYFDLIEDHAHSDDPVAAKAHFYEALLYFLWAPFVNQYASVFGGGSGSEIGKTARFLYIHGEPNAGKGTFVKFALRLLSENTVTQPADASRIGKRTIDAARRPMTAFPFVIDDIERKRIHRLDVLRNYWAGWQGDSFPALVFTSNDNKPPDWFMERAKMVQFKLKFTGIMESQLEMGRLLREDNRLFRWFSRLYLDQEIDFREFKDEWGERDDMLAPARTAMMDLYDAAGRDLPVYFPRRPAEWVHDIGRERWQHGYENQHFVFERNDGTIVASFTDDFEGYEIDTHYLQNLPRHVRAQRVGRAIHVKSPEAFERWFGTPVETKSRMLSRLRSRLSK